MEKRNGLVIRFFCGAYALCDGKCPAGVEPEEGEIYIGNLVKMFDTWEEADAMRKIIDAAYSADQVSTPQPRPTTKPVCDSCGRQAELTEYIDPENPSIDRDSGAWMLCQECLTPSEEATR